MKKGQVNIHSGVPLSKSKSFSRKGKLKIAFKEHPNLFVKDKKPKIKERILMWVFIGLLFVTMLYYVFFVGLKETNFFGAETKNVEALW